MKRTQLGQNLAAFLLENQTAPNKQFGASGGVARPTPCVGQHPPLSSKPYQYPRLPPSRRALAAICGQRSDIGRRKKCVTDSLGEFINEKQIVKK